MRGSIWIYESEEIYMGNDSKRSQDLEYINISRLVIDICVKLHSVVDEHT